jgi:hypothetical protein
LDSIEGENGKYFLQTFLCGKLTGFSEGKFFAEIISFDHCSATSVAIHQNQSPAKKIKLGITKASTAKQ